VMAGSERRTRVMNPHEKETVAVHEAGHALLASLLPGMDRVHKVTIVPRGRALGYTWQRPTEDRFLLSEQELQSRLMVLLGGRVAEGIAFNEISTGGADDLTRATDVARRMVTEYGMSPALGPVRLAADPQVAYLGQAVGLDARVSQTTSAMVDVETRRLVEEAVERARHLLESSTMTVDQIASEIGFATAASLRQHMSAELGVSPRAYRRTFQVACAARPTADLDAATVAGHGRELVRP